MFADTLEFMDILPTSSEVSPFVISPWDDATFELMLDTLDVFQVAQSLKIQQDRLGGIWASEYFPGLFPNGGFWNASAAFSAFGRRYGSLEEASSWEVTKETWLTAKSYENKDELHPFAYALAHVPLTTEQAEEAVSLLSAGSFRSGTLMRRLANNPAFQDAELCRTVAHLSPQRDPWDAPAGLTRIRQSLISSRYIQPDVAEALLPARWDSQGRASVDYNLVAKNPVLSALHGKVVEAAERTHMDDVNAADIRLVAVEKAGQFQNEMEALSSFSTADLKEDRFFAQSRTRTLLYVAASTRDARARISVADQNRLSSELGRLLLPAIKNPADWTGRQQTNYSTGLPHVARYVREEFNKHSDDVDANELPVTWLLELFGE